ncbi:unnamed protein product [Lactuca saligna]|uniref:Uncharacterized protein n=1 Tax=Lactuca saligna TaxID=75948 RepID=A0AA35USQ1_LACSI|nr:unnamed protein product [Lactuca saligna]
MSTSEAQGTTSIATSAVHVSIILSSYIETTLIDTSTSLPPLRTQIPTLLHASTVPPTYNTIMNQPITSIFPSQSTEGDKSIPDDSQDDDDFMVSFADIQFDPEEENIPDHILMSRNRFTILNHKLSYLLQIQADT